MKGNEISPQKYFSSHFGQSGEEVAGEAEPKDCRGGRQYRQN